MEIDSFNDIYGNPIFKVFISNAKARKNQLRQHRHTEFELSLILFGTGNYKTQKDDFDIQQDDIFLFSTNEFHCITDIHTNNETDCMMLLNMHFSPNFVANNNILPNANNYMDIFFNRNQNFSNRLTRDNPYTPLIKEYILKIREECEKKQENYQTMVQTLTTTILLLIYRHYNYTNQKSSKSISLNNKYKANLINALAFINNHYCENISLNEIVAHARLSKTTFIAVFKNIYGMTTWDYINIKRIEQALALLKNTDDTILSIASQCGYNNTANFNKIFKAVTGITPKEYRKNNR